MINLDLVARLRLQRGVRRPLRPVPQDHLIRPDGGARQ